MLVIMSTMIALYAGALLVGLAVGFLFKLNADKKIKRKIQDYQKEIHRSHSRILMLESHNNELEKRVQQSDFGSKMAV